MHWIAGAAGRSRLYLYPQLLYLLWRGISSMYVRISSPPFDIKFDKLNNWVNYNLQDILSSSDEDGLEHFSPYEFQKIYGR